MRIGRRLWQDRLPAPDAPVDRTRASQVFCALTKPGYYRMYLTLECICFSNLDNREHDVGYLLQAPQPALCAAPTDSTLWAAAEPPRARVLLARHLARPAST